MVGIDPSVLALANDPGLGDSSIFNGVTPTRYGRPDFKLAEAAKIDPHIHFIAGGFHLVVAQDPAIEKVAIALHDTYKVDYIAPGHCTGEATFAALQTAFGERYLYAGLGTTLGAGANPRADSDRSATYALDESDLRSYRTLLAQSDDLDDAEPEAVRLAQAK